MPEAEIPEEPQPLTEDEQSAAIEQIRELASQQELRTRNIYAYSPVVLPTTITARTAHVSWGSIKMYQGFFDSELNCFQTAKASGTADPFVISLRGLQLGAHYMLDITVRADDTTWVLGGVFSGRVRPSAGHLIVGFIAKSTASSLHLYPYQRNIGYLYRAKLTRLN